MRNNSLTLQFAGSFLLGCLASISPVQAQIVPDNTLPVNSRVTPGCVVCTINGGTVRGVNLFHSFREFSVPTGGQAYFNNAAQIQNILGRITGTSLSNIDGLIRANGSANLYLLNPNGFLFGPNARLQIGGSFVATTASSIQFPDGSEFSATNPQAPPLLAVTVTPGVQYGARAAGSTIANRGNLVSGQDLTLAAHNLDLQGQLQAGRDLTLLASNTVTALDSRTIPFVATAGRNLLVQGNQGVDIAALSHPNSGLASGGDLVLRSDNTVGGDAHFWSGGSFRIERLDGSLGNLYSPHDPIIQTAGNVTFNTYTGASLHILAGGSVTVTGDIRITGTAPDGQALVEDVTLSDGTVISIDGTAKPTVDIRAGIDPRAIGNQFIIGVGFDPTPPGLTAPPSSADITIGSITIIPPNGLVFLSNQYKPDQLLPGNITLNRVQGTEGVVTRGGPILIDSRGDIGINEIVNTTPYAGFNSNVGKISLIAANSLNVNPGASLQSASFANGDAGDINISAGKSVTFDRSFAFSTLEPDANGEAGDITVTANSVSLLGNAQIFSRSSGIGDAGDVTIIADTVVNIFGPGGGSVAVSPNIGSDVVGKARGNGGRVTISARSVQLLDGALIAASIFQGTGKDGGFARAGDVNITATEKVLLQGGSRIFSEVRNTGSRGIGGNITLDAPVVEIKDGSGVITRVGVPRGFQDFPQSPEGQAGNITIRTHGGRVAIEGTGVGTDVRSSESGIRSELQPRVLGNLPAGQILIDTGTLDLSNGGIISVTTAAAGQGGSISLIANAITLASDSQITSSTFDQGKAGEISINTPTLTFLDASSKIAASTSGSGGGGSLKINQSQPITISGPGQLTVETTGPGKAGDITINAPSIALDNQSKINAETSSTGAGGSITLTGNSVALASRSQVTASTSGTGDGGDITINVVDKFTLTGAGSPLTDLTTDTGIYAATTPASSGRGGSITIAAQPGTNPAFLIQNGAKIAANSQGTGDGGTINLKTDGRITLKNYALITSQTNSETADAGNINIDPDILLLRNHSQISTSAAAGKGSGGNINITAGFVVGVLFEDSNIVANAFEGKGGNININANGIFGFLQAPPRILDTPFSDIAASSQFGFSGTIILNTLNIDPSQGLTEVNLNPEDPSKRVAQGCASGKRIALNQDRFIITGRSGLSASPDDVFRDARILTELGIPATPTDTQTSNPTSSSSPSPTAPTNNLVEAQGWIVAPNGKVRLVAQSANLTPPPNPQPSITCPDGSSFVQP
ncbi:filamentous hemagglutinin N-terminal domain-containing protein [Kovacikia minuta CCNUW1]|uniref:two-partner secretion domain-containing protein n=1 Tax=Kovacikia minuta TaxID=2931930 RepID=UPI001CCEA21A|nr:filamentous hemagglutinin N-terminal domain-containing protein [Kovacikia minuta]UBF27675.1 filamentous hemagglutinin N-terminal domain-containing protein [Kovacikia minuta CCNUW1]